MKLVRMSKPNQLTTLRILLTPVLALAMLYEENFWALGIFVAAALTDWYDGYVARTFGGATRTGKYLDPLADKLLVMTAFGIFAYLEYVPVWMFWVIALRDILITALRAYAMSTEKQFETSSVAKWKTATQMLSIFLLLIWIIASQSYAGEKMPFVIQKIQDWNLVWSMLLLVTLYTLYTGVLYLLDNRRHLKSLAMAFYRVFVPTNVR